MSSASPQAELPVGGRFTNKAHSLFGEIVLRKDIVVSKGYSSMYMTVFDSTLVNSCKYPGESPGYFHDYIWLTGVFCVLEMILKLQTYLSGTHIVYSIGFKKRMMCISNVYQWGFVVVGDGWARLIWQSSCVNMVECLVVILSCLIILITLWTR